LKVLAAQNSPQLGAALQTGLLSKSPVLRREAIRLQTSLPDATERLDAILTKGSTADQQAVFSALPLVPGQAADQILDIWMGKLLAKQVPAAARLDLLDAAGKSKSTAVQGKLKQYETARDPKDSLAKFRECLEGGDAAAGKKVFMLKAEVQCTRCHLIGTEGGGNVGPNLIDIGKRQTREYILESIIDPNARIAPGFESAGIKLKNDKFYTGVVKGETDADITLDTGTDHGIVKLRKSDIKKRVVAPSPMPQDIAAPLTKDEIRNIVEFLAGQKG
jgi:quinoprotein glucose dehydrogenase